MRRLCVESAKLQSALSAARFGVAPENRIDVGKQVLSTDEVLKLCRSCKRIVVVPEAGSQISSASTTDTAGVDAQEYRPTAMTDAELLKTVASRRGAVLRVPALVSMQTLYIGFSDSYFQNQLLPALQLSSSL